MKKQTAVEWLIEQIHPTISITLEDVCIKELIEIAKAMEREQIKNAHKDNATMYEMDADAQAEQYYNETYGN